MKKPNLIRLLSLSLCAVLLLLVLTGCMGVNGAPATNEDGTLKLIETTERSQEVKLGFSDYFKLPFSYLLSALYSLTGNYGLALILFAIVVKIILFPTSAKGKKSMMKMSRLTPKRKALEAKYADDRQALSMAINQLYKEEGVGGCGGCLWSILPLLLMLPLFYIVREPITWLMFHGNVDPKTMAEIQNVFITARNEAFLAEPNSALAQFNATGFYWQVEALPFIDQLKDQLAAISPNIVSMNTRFFGVEMGTIPNFAFWRYFDIHGVWNSIGQFLLPMLSGGISMLSMWISQKMNSMVIVNEKGEQDPEMARRANQNNMSMMLTMPLFSIYIGFVAPAGLSLYWFIQGLIGMVQDVLLTKHYKKIYDEEDAVKQAQAAQQAAIEAERERQRALRRAENPDGMVGSTSKKKLQQRERVEQAAKEAAYLAQRFGGEEAEAKGRSTDDSRPFRRGRNYDPNRYKNDKE